MKSKLLLFFATVALLFLVSCTSDEVLNEPFDKNGLVTFTLKTPELTTRALGDGTTANTLQWAVYDATGAKVAGLEGSKTINLETTISLKLANGKTYSVLFFAGNEAAPYTVDFDSKQLTVDYTATVANQETYDAFFKYVEPFVVSGSTNQVVELRRPFAQINIGTDDATDAANLGTQIAKSGITVATYSSLNLATGEVSNLNEQTFSPSEIIGLGNFLVQSNGNTYDYLSMNYILVGSEQELVDVQFTYDNNTRTFSSVPVQRNYRTNIYGSLLTANANFQVNIVSDFQTPDKDVEVESVIKEQVAEGLTKVTDSQGNVVYEASTVNGLAKGIEKVKDGDVSVMLTADIDGKNWSSFAVDGYNGASVVTLDGKGHKITELTTSLIQKTWAGNSGVIIKNLTIDQANMTFPTSSGTGAGAFIAISEASPQITLENCHLTNSTIDGGYWTGGLIGFAGGYSGTDGPVFENITIVDCTVLNNNITGAGSVGSIFGHATSDEWTKATIENVVVEGNTIVSTGSSDKKAGIILGTVGVAGTEKVVNGVAKTGGVYITNLTQSGNSVTSNGVAIDRLYGRQGDPKAKLFVDGVEVTLEY